MLREKVMPPHEQVDELKSQLSRAVSRMQARQAEAEGAVRSIFNTSPGRYQMQTSPDLSAEQSASARKHKLEQPRNMHPLTYLLLVALAKAGELETREFGKSVALYSSEGCEVQEWHLDFSDKLKHNPVKRVRGGSSRGDAQETHPSWEERLQQIETIRDMQDRQKPQGVFWALEDGCKIMLAGPEGEAVEVCLERGDVLLFDGDLVHAGAAYPASDNVRMHVYLYARGVNKPAGNTWNIPEFVPTRVVQWHSGQRRAASV